LLVDLCHGLVPLGMFTLHHFHLQLVVGDTYFDAVLVLFGAQASVIIRIWWIALWAGFDGSVLSYDRGSRGCSGMFCVILPRGRICRWFVTQVFRKAFPTIHFKEYTAFSKVEGGKDVTYLWVYRKARMILWALEYDGSGWGMTPQNIAAFIPPRKIANLHQLKHFDASDDDDFDDEDDFDDDLDTNDEEDEPEFDFENSVEEEERVSHWMEEDGEEVQEEEEEEEEKSDNDIDAQTTAIPAPSATAAPSDTSDDDDIMEVWDATHHATTY
jgi:hypothetical protein